MKLRVTTFHPLYLQTNLYTFTQVLTFVFYAPVMVFKYCLWRIKTWLDLVHRLIERVHRPTVRVCVCLPISHS